MKKVTKKKKLNKPRQESCCTARAGAIRSVASPTTPVQPTGKKLTNSLARTQPLCF